MSEFRLLGGISYLIFCAGLGVYMWTMPEEEQREVGRALYNSPTGQALVELNKALCELGQVIGEGIIKYIININTLKG